MEKYCTLVSLRQVQKQSVKRMQFNQLLQFRRSTRSWKEILKKMVSLKFVKSWELVLSPGARLEWVILLGRSMLRTTLDPQTDLRSGFDRFSPDNLSANRPIVELLQSSCSTGTSNACASRIGMASCSEAIYCSNSRYTQSGSPQ